MPPPRQVTKCRNEDIQQNRNCEVDYLSGRTGADSNRTERDSPLDTGSGISRLQVAYSFPN
jgi:hypothetical protein